MSHYYTNDDTLESDRHYVKYYPHNKELSFISDAGVFSKNAVDFGTNTLIECALSLCNNGCGLDLGCGIGIIGITLCLLNENVSFDMVDINERAVGLAKENASKYELENKMNIQVSNGFEKVAKVDYDFILTNPPIRAGKAVIYKFFEDSYGHLKDNGFLLVVIQKKQGAPSAKAKLTEIFGNCEIVDRNKGYYLLKSTKNAL